MTPLYRSDAIVVQAEVNASNAFKYDGATTFVAMTKDGRFLPFVPDHGRALWLGVFDTMGEADVAIAQALKGDPE